MKRFLFYHRKWCRATEKNYPLADLWPRLMDLGGQKIHYWGNWGQWSLVLTFTSSNYLVFAWTSLVMGNSLLLDISRYLGSAGKESTCNAADLGSIPGLGRSPGEGKGYPLQYSGLENPMDCIVHGVAKSWTRLSAFHFLWLSCYFWLVLTL